MGKRTLVGLGLTALACILFLILMDDESCEECEDRFISELTEEDMDRIGVKSKTGLD